MQHTRNAVRPKLYPKSLKFRHRQSFMRFDKSLGKQLWVNLVQQRGQSVHDVKDPDVFTRTRINDGGTENVIRRKSLRCEKGKKTVDDVNDNDAA